LKYSGEKLVSSIYVYTDIKLMLFLVVVIVGIMLRWGLTVLERMNKIIFTLIVLQLIILLVFLFSGFSIKNVTPISTLDIIPLFKASVYILAVSSYISFVFIFNDQIKYGTKNFGKFAFITIFLTIASTLIILAALGNFGYEFINKLLFPFMSAIKTIYIFEETAGLDALFITIWMLADFITISFFSYCIVRLIKNVFNLNSQLPALTAVLGFAFFFAVFLNNNVFELVIFSQTVAFVGSLALCFVVPLALFITAKARKMI
ncbi:MAG: GerAB/ArcD/ProY family transporter, partial [Clostridia bacterium]|nr:GerAB/ArcD/ProY family transporter [Clostridia bacterium]